MPRTALVLTLCLTLALAAQGLAGDRTDAGGREAPQTRDRTFRIEPVLQVQIAPRLHGVTWDGDDFWLSQLGDGGSNPPRFIRTDDQGIVQGSVDHGDPWVNGFAGIHFYNGFLWGSECAWLRGLGLDGSWSGSPFFIGSAVFTIDEPILAVAQNAALNRWFIGGQGEAGQGRHVYSAVWNGTDGTPMTWTPITSLPLPANGIAYDQSRDCLWVTDGVTGTLHKLDPDGGPSLGEIPFLGSLFGKPRGCCIGETTQEAELIIVLAVVLVDEEDRADDWLVMWDIEDIDDAITPVEAASWTSIKNLYR